MSAFVKIRVTDATALIAQQAVKSGELLELQDKRGRVHKGWVREVQYEMGVDYGWWCWFEMADDVTTQDVIAQVMAMREKVKP